MTDTSATHAFAGPWGERAQLALDTLALRPTRGIPTWMLNDMQWSHLESFSGHPPGSYERDPARVYLAFQQAAGVCYIDQWIPENPLSMKTWGYDDTQARGATTGAEMIVRDGIVIDSPEAVVQHLEHVVFPRALAERQALEEDADARVRRLIEGEAAIQESFGNNLLKGPYGGFQ
ncbi:MAG: hypothetical protein GX590_05915, partial [Lentisphaerae bacterium]|nr:hypothetical protein [Lentisphaerota bacterium]